MRKNIPIYSVIVIGLILSMAILAVSVQKAPKIVKNPYFDLSIKADPPIQINGDGGFATFPGFGNETHPYLIENYIINSGATSGIWIQNTLAHFVIRNCTITSLTYGIYLNNVSNGIVENSTLNNNNYGFYVINARNITITNSTILTNAYNGIEVNTGYNLTISHNIAQNNDIGIRLNNLNNCRVINNTASNNGGFFGASGGIYLDNGYDVLILENTASNTAYGDGIELYRVNNSNIINNTAQNNDNYGIYHWDSHHNEIKNNTVRIAFSAIYVGYSNYNNLTHNLATDAINVGIMLYKSNYTNVTDNRAYDNNLGIYLYTSIFNFVSRNIASNTLWNGISLYDHSCHNTIHNNTCNNNHRGIYIWEFSSYNTITWNTLNNNAVCIGEMTCFGNVIEHNNCLNTTGDYIPGFEGIFLIMSLGLILLCYSIMKKKF